jgi:3-methyladenine DNA glycosylase Mpg
MAENELLNKLNAIHESKKEEIEGAFDEVAKKIFYEYVLVLGKHNYRITEIEFYYNDECCTNKHPDPYTHRHYRQRLNAQWYFHRKGRGGLDITFGKGENCKIYGGILIRAIEKQNEINNDKLKQNKKKDNKPKNDETNNYTEGPCKVVDKIFEVIKLKKVIKEESVFNTNNILHLFKDNIDSQNKITIYKAPRVGLQPNKDKPEWKKFIMKNYRYFVKHTNLCNYPSKDRELIILSLLKNHKITVDCLKKVFHFITRRKKICEYLTNYKAGNNLREKTNNDTRKEFINETYTNFGVEKKCKLYGLLNEVEKK